MIRIAPLHDHPAHWPTLARALEAQWPDWYGPAGPGRALADVQAYAQPAGLPAGLLRLEDEAAIGLVAIKTAGLDSHPELRPMLGAAWVRPDRHGQGLGAQLLRAGAALAAARGVHILYSATHEGARLFAREHWQAVATVLRDGRPLHVFGKCLAPAGREAGGV